MKGFPLGLAQFPFYLVVGDSFRRFHFTVGYLRRKASAFTSFLTHVGVHRQQLAMASPKITCLRVANEDLALRGG